ncbi:3-oxoacyl-[acyl-carrier-protein] reductase [Chloroflexota bacterium]
MNISLDGKAALITGASRGIGKAIAFQLAESGASVIVNYLSSEKEADSVIHTINEMGGNAVAIQADVSIFEEAQSLIQSSIELSGKLDILVNNSGITKDKLLMMMSEEEWDEVLKVNLKGTFNCSKAVVKHMVRNRSGRIINITSVSGQMGNAGQTNYSASKAGQIGFTKALAREIASRNVTVNGIAAGYIDTEIWKDVPDEMRNSVINLIPMGRKGSPEDIANIVSFLASDHSSYITGQIIGVDGGMAMM